MTKLRGRSHLRVSSIAEGGWFWTMYARVGNRCGSSSGQVTSRDKGVQSFLYGCSPLVPEL